MVVRLKYDDSRWKTFKQEFPEKKKEVLALILREVGLVMQRAIIRNIETQGQEFGAVWAPPSKWTMAKKGPQVRLLEAAIPHIKFKATPKTVRVYFDGDGVNWSLSEHQTGFSEQPSGGRVEVKLVYPSALNTDRDSISFISARTSIVPPRRVWPTDGYVRQKVDQIVSREWEQFGRDL